MRARCLARSPEMGGWLNLCFSVCVCVCVCVISITRFRCAFGQGHREVTPPSPDCTHPAAPRPADPCHIRARRAREHVEEPPLLKSPV